MDDIVSRANPVGAKLPDMEASHSDSLSSVWVGRVVELCEAIIACGSYGRPGMRARVAKIRKCGQHGVAVTLDFTDFREANKPLEVVAWPDGDTLVTLTADEAGAYEPIEDYYFLDMGTLFRAMAIVSGETSLALQRAHASDEPSSGYINWLEDKLAEARPDLLKEFQAEVEIN